MTPTAVNEPVMPMHPLRPLAAACLCVGPASARTRPSYPVTALQERLLQPRELRGFTSPICPVVEPSPARWATGGLAARALTRNGFVAGLRKPLESKRLHA